MIFIIAIVILVIIIRKENIKKYNESTYNKETNNNIKNVINDKGKYGEYKTSTQLDKLFCKKYILFNLYLPKANDENKTTEIDILMITNRMIYVIENKNYNGKIYGNEKQAYWYYYLGGKKYKIYNPIMQNKTHIKALESIIENNKILPIIVFGNNANIEKITAYENVICYEKDLLKVIAANEQYNEIKYSDDEMESIYNKLKKYTGADEETKQKHIDEIEKRNRANFQRQRS